ncbi:multidrug resistance-associated protein 4-like [Actinia tenebrosa]|uniref:Multidrug resistance-associated protein 4-like n=1 Tax=Actinia tenebrosa TaxID=6105 RepID=A0A6P8H3E9_ACTTE|nr:multidrug resistance-associated protein 4-like [Actinia tenebrosa]
MGGKYQRLASDTGSKTLKKGIFSYLFFTWLNGLLKLGYQRPLVDDDLLELSDENKAQGLVGKLHGLWMEEINSAKKRGRKPRLWKAMFKLFLRDVILFTALKLIDEAMAITLVVSVWFYLKFLEEGSHMDQTYAVGIVASIGIPSLIKVFFYHHSDYLTVLMGVRLKSAVIGLIQKTITESRRSDLSKFTTGHIVNLVSNDAKGMDELGISLAEVLLTPFVVVAVVVLLPLLVGWPSLSCLLLMFVLIIINLLLTQLYTNIRLEQVKVTDKRLAAMSEIICGIRAVKMYAWEWKYNETVQALRGKEVNCNKQKNMIQTSFQMLKYNVTPIASFLCVVALVYSGIRVDAARAFTLTMILDICAYCLAVKIAFRFTKLRDSIVSIYRIEQFLCNRPTLANISTSAMIYSKDTQPHKIGSLTFTKNIDSRRATCIELDTEPRVNIIEMSAAWTSQQKSVLHQVSMVVRSNQLLIVTGPVGSGKSSLLMAILGEIPTTEGEITVHGRTGYVSQIPWIFSASIRDNIVFGRPFDESRYKRILEMCDLQKDIKCFPHEDLTIIGQRGVGLSGGQRARLSLARAVYSEADIFLLDDPLSAVDARVGQHIFDKCICGELSNRVRVLATHQVQYLPRADKIAVVREGAVLLGTYSELSENGVVDTLQKRHEDTTSDYTLHEDVVHYKDDNSKDMREEDEDRATGTVSWRLYWRFFKAGLPSVIIGCLALFYIIAQASSVVPTWWMSRIVHMTLQDQRGSFSLGVFGGLVGASFILFLVKDLAFVSAILRSTRKLHDKMTLAVIKSPVLFFDTNPAGRIMNRFSKDIGAMDDLLPIQFLYSAETSDKKRKSYREVATDAQEAHKELCSKAAWIHSNV